MNDEIFRLSLIDVMNEGLLNDFVNDIFGYDFDIPTFFHLYDMSNSVHPSRREQLIVHRL